jgi:hypothetical protein
MPVSIDIHRYNTTGPITVLVLLLACLYFHVMTHEYVLILFWCSVCGSLVNAQITISLMEPISSQETRDLASSLLALSDEVVHNSPPEEEIPVEDNLEEYLVPQAAEEDSLEDLDEFPALPDDILNNEYHLNDPNFVAYLDSIESGDSYKVTLPQ